MNTNAMIGQSFVDPRLGNHVVIEVCGACPQSPDYVFVQVIDNPSRRWRENAFGVLGILVAQEGVYQAEGLS